MTTIRNLLSKINATHFYLMHLSHATKQSRRKCWEYALKHSLIGLDQPDVVMRDWREIPESVKNKLSLSQRWHKQFDLFYYEMDKGDCVVVVNGWEYILGIGFINCEFPSYTREHKEDFFEHTRRVRWLIRYNYEDFIRLQKPAVSFNNTILRIDEGSKYWYPVVNTKLRDRIDAGDISEVKKIIKKTQDKIKKAKEEIYNEGGLKEVKAEMPIRNPRVVWDAKKRYGVECKICGFNFEEKYGKWGNGFIEVHHLKPMSQYKRRITLDDVTVVCSNCHRMLHKCRPQLSLDDLKSKIRKRND